jgi:hypothetical protein
MASTVPLFPPSRLIENVPRQAFSAIASFLGVAPLLEISTTTRRRGLEDLAARIRELAFPLFQTVREPEDALFFMKQIHLVQRDSPIEPYDVQNRLLNEFLPSWFFEPRRPGERTLPPIKSINQELLTGRIDSAAEKFAFRLVYWEARSIRNILDQVLLHFQKEPYFLHADLVHWTTQWRHLDNAPISLEEIGTMLAPLALEKNPPHPLTSRELATWLRGELARTPDQEVGAEKLTLLDRQFSPRHNSLPSPRRFSSFPFFCIVSQELVAWTRTWTHENRTPLSVEQMSRFLALLPLQSPPRTPLTSEEFADWIAERFSHPDQRIEVDHLKPLAHFAPLPQGSIDRISLTSWLVKEHQTIARIDRLHLDDVPFPPDFSLFPGLKALYITGCLVPPKLPEGLEDLTVLYATTPSLTLPPFLRELHFTSYLNSVITNVPRGLQQATLSAHIVMPLKYGWRRLQEVTPARDLMPILPLERVFLWAPPPFKGVSLEAVPLSKLAFQKQSFQPAIVRLLTHICSAAGRTFEDAIALIWRGLKQTVQEGFQRRAWLPFRRFENGPVMHLTSSPDGKPTFRAAKGGEVVRGYTTFKDQATGETFLEYSPNDTRILFAKNMARLVWKTLSQLVIAIGCTAYLPLLAPLRLIFPPKTSSKDLSQVLSCFALAPLAIPIVLATTAIHILFLSCLLPLSIYGLIAPRQAQYFYAQMEKGLLSRVFQTLPVLQPVPRSFLDEQIASETTPPYTREIEPGEIETKTGRVLAGFINALFWY